MRKDGDPSNLENEPKKYSRLIMVRKAEVGIDVLVQLLDNGLVVFPGGKDEPNDGDSIGTIIREVNEEGKMNKGQLKNLEDFDLLWGSFVFKVAWHMDKTPCVDTYHLIQTIGHDYDGIAIPNDDEIKKAEWVNLGLLAAGIVPFKAKVPKNIRLAAIKSLQFVPELMEWYSKNSVSGDSQDNSTHTF